MTTSALARIEVMRAVKRTGDDEHVSLAEILLVRVIIVRMEPRVLRLAASVDPAALRSLDAIHLASALEIGDRLTAFITYDRQLGAAAEAAGLKVEIPGVR